jgi:hypothetical protein
MDQFKKAVIRAVEVINGFGFSLIVGSVIYFIIGSIAGLVGGEMLNWTFCGSAHRLLDVDWCGIQGDTGEAGFDHFIHRLFNVTIPWFMMFWGFVLTGISSLLLNVLGYKYRPPGSTD